MQGGGTIVDIRPTTSRHVPHPSPDRFVDYVVSSPVLRRSKAVEVLQLKRAKAPLRATRASDWSTWSPRRQGSSAQPPAHPQTAWGDQAADISSTLAEGAAHAAAGEHEAAARIGRALLQMALSS
eukprot:TRINITY_DN219_c0_g1_i4.p2 TRINITY_DN219_c0_g1~~TRINITY_DN219_c0_g1_i4.p2  ORF type:complete len:125 (-),score=18.20 TRINITY_DN219_c0_g1_i4:678-1052(-)